MKKLFLLLTAVLLSAGMVVQAQSERTESKSLLSESQHNDVNIQKISGRRQGPPSNTWWVYYDIQYLKLIRTGNNQFKFGAYDNGGSCDFSCINISTTSNNIIGSATKSINNSKNFLWLNVSGGDYKFTNLSGSLTFTFQNRYEGGYPVYRVYYWGTGMNNGYTYNVGFDHSIPIRAFDTDETTPITLINDPVTIRTAVASGQSAMGTVSPTSVTVERGSTVTISAEENEDYEFVSWSDSGAQSHSITASDDATYTATFKKASSTKYTITTGVNNSDWGSITPGGEKSLGSTFNITATPTNDNYYLYDWEKTSGSTTISMGVRTNPLPVTITTVETYTAVFAQRTKKTLFCDDDMTFAGNGPYTFSGTATDAQNNEYNISLSTTNVSQGNFSVQEKTNAINSITSKSGTVTTSQLSNTYYAVNAVVIGSDEVRYDISGGFPLAASGSYQNFTISELITAEEVTVPGAPTIVESPFNPSNQKLIHLKVFRDKSPWTHNYVELWIKAPAQQYNTKTGPAEGTYQTYAPSFSCSSGWSFNYATGLIGYNDDGCWNDDGDHYVCYVSSYCADKTTYGYPQEKYFSTNTTISVEKGKNGDMFVVIYVSGSPYIVIGEPAAPPTLVLGETTNGTFSATDGTKNYTAGRYKMPIGAQLSLTATPAEGYVVAKWLLNGEEVGDELGNLMKATELTYTVASEDVVDDKITIVPVFGEKSDCTMVFDDIAVELNEQEHSARLVATNSVGGVAVLDFIGLTSFDEQIGVSAGTYTIGTDLVVGNAVAQTGSYVTDGSSTWNLASGTITIAKANGKMTLTTSSVKSTDPQNVTLTATNITCSIVRRITYIINNALYSDNNENRFRFIGTTVDNKEISICFYGNELNPVGTYTNDEIYDGDYPNNYVTIAGVKCYNVQYATVTKEGYYYILDAEFDNPNGGYYHVIMKALVPKNDDTMEDYLVTRNVSSSYVTFAESDITVTQQAEGYQYLHAKTGGDNYMEAKMYFYTGSAESGIPTGTYTISDSQQPGTVRMINSTAYRSYTQTNWYIAQGTVTVVHQNNHYYIVVRAFNTRYKANDNRLYTVNFTIGTEITAQTYKVTFYDEDGETELQSSDVEYNTQPSCTEPTKDATAQYTYTFAGWTDGTNTYSTADLPVVTDEAAYTATYTETKRKYTVKWKNGDSVLETDENVEYGATPSYNGAPPTKAEDENFSYTFAGWTDGTNTYSTADLPVVTGDATYTATYTSQAKAFVIYEEKGKGDAFYTTLAGMKDKAVPSVTYERNLAAKTWNVFSLPFNYLLAGSGHSFEGNVYELASTDYDYDTDWLSLNFMPVTTILQANKPYLFYSSTDVNNPVFENVTMAELTTNYYTVTNTGAGGSIEFRNTTYLQQLEKNNSHIVFITNNKLYYMGGNNIYMRAFRGYFYLNGFDLNTSAAPRVRIVLNGQTATELEVVSDMPASENGVRKYIKNGTLVIEREGVRYDATGAKMN